MSKSNIRLLTKDERKYFNDTYIFVLKSDVILVRTKEFRRYTSHPIDSDFSINSKVRKIKISKEAIELWSKSFIDSKWSLIDIQNAVNSLIITYQQITYDAVHRQLVRIDEQDNTLKL